MPPPKTMAEVSGQNNSTWNDAEAKKLPEKTVNMKLNGVIPVNGTRQKVVVVGLGMVGIAFMYGSSVIWLEHNSNVCIERNS
jgi:hypothetical protein